MQTWGSEHQTLRMPCKAINLSFEMSHKIKSVEIQPTSVSEKHFFFSFRGFQENKYFWWRENEATFFCFLKQVWKQVKVERKSGTQSCSVYGCGMLVRRKLLFHWLMPSSQKGPEIGADSMGQQGPGSELCLASPWCQQGETHPPLSSCSINVLTEKDSSSPIGMSLVVSLK